MQYTVRFILLLILASATRSIFAEPDALLAQFAKAHQTRPDSVRPLAKRLGTRLHEREGQTLVPVIVKRETQNLPSFLSRLTAVNAVVDSTSRSWIRLLVPIQNLEQLFQGFPNTPLQAPYPTRSETNGYGSIVSESVALTWADGYQAGNLIGSGVKVAVVDLGFKKLSDAAAAGELPSDALSRAIDYTGANNVQTVTQHGTGVAEHVADMAPGAEIYYLKVSDQVDLQNAADYIASEGIDIANHSVAWLLSSYYDGTGTVNDIINDSHDTDGVFWTISAGNAAKKHWRGIWLDADSDSVLEFSSGDEGMEMTSGTTSFISLYLNWDQYYSGSKADLDLYLLDKNGTTVASSTIRQRNNTAPYEAIGYDPNNPAGSDAGPPYRIEVRHKSGTVTGLDITLFSFNNDFEHVITEASVADPASAPGAFTVGAVAYTNWNSFNPAVRSYSSRGYTTDGRLKPDLVAPDNTTSLTYGVSTGTSFSAPTTAGAAALLLSETPSLSNTQIRDILYNNAIDIRAVGLDGDSGYGKLQLPLIDSDGDQLDNVAELGLGTNPLDSDSDGDGLDDGEEVNTYLTDPLDSDSDDDTLSDGDEISAGTDPLDADSDDDGLNDNVDPLPNTPNIADGDVNQDSVLDTADLLLMQRIMLGITSPDNNQLAHGDVFPAGAPDGIIDLRDLLNVTQDIQVP